MGVPAENSIAESVNSAREGRTPRSQKTLVESPSVNDFATSELTDECSARIDASRVKRREKLSKR
jgi:hypothetical protein